MDTNEVKKLKWVCVENWSKLIPTSYNSEDSYNVVESDVDDFVENTFKEVAQNLNIPYKELKPILDERNSSFISAKERVFSTYGYMKIRHPILLKLENLLIIPDITTVNKV